MNEQVEKNDIVESFADTMINTSQDTILDLSELGVDAMLEEGIVKEVPLIKVGYSLMKTTLAIRDRHNIKKFIKFINEFNSGNIEQNKYDNFKKKIEKKDEELYKNLEYLLLIIDRYAEEEKMKILSKFFIAYINEQISYYEFKDFSVILERFLLSDMTSLSLIYECDREFDASKDLNGCISRLMSLGLIYQISLLKRKGSLGFDLDIPDNDISITEFGRNFYRFGFLE